MKFLTLFLLFTAIPAIAQTDASREAEVQRLAQMAALMPSSAEFDDAWKVFVDNFVNDMAEADAAIEEIRQGADDFRRQVRVPGGSGGPAMPGYRLRDKMRALAAEVLGTDVKEE